MRAETGVSVTLTPVSGTPSAELTAEESQRLKDLLKEQQQLQAAQTLSQYQTLAKQIAEIASATGETYQQVIDEMGIKNANPEKGLKLANDDALKAYITDLQKQKDSNKENTHTIVAALNRIYDAIAHPGSLPGNDLSHSGCPLDDVPNSAIVDAIDRQTLTYQQAASHTLRTATAGNGNGQRNYRGRELM